MREKNRKPIASYIKLPQFTTMNVIDGQAGVIIYSSLICYSLTIDNILNIIVLLILAGVTVVTLTGDNGLLQKAQNAGEQSKIAEAEEQIKLIYAEYQISKYAEGNTSAGDYLKEQLEKTYGEGNVDIISQEESIVLKVTNNGESKFYEYNPSTGISKELQKGINYNGKTASEIRPGDDITIVTEKFKVFSVENNTIKAMPYYNITLTNKPVQSKNAEYIDFSTECYWENPTEEIDMTDSRNNIQTYINNYNTTLQQFESENIQVRALKYDDYKNIGNDYPKLNPGGTHPYWVASCMNFSGDMILNIVQTNGIVFRWNYFRKDCIGVRPIIEIPIE